MNDILEKFFDYKKPNKKLFSTSELENLQEKIRLCKSNFLVNSLSYKHIEEMQNKIQESIDSIKAWNSSNS